MVRFLHTADIQLGMRATTVPEVADRIREQRFDTLERIVALAKAEAVDFVVIAGDLFEDNQVSADTAHRAVKILGDAGPVPVYILPGNHDPLTADSVYRRPVFGERKPENLYVLQERTSVSVSGVSCILYPCPVLERRSLFDPTSDLCERVRAEQGTVRIGIAHGALAIEGRHSADDHPIAPDIASKSGLDYLALGHWHKCYACDKHTAYYCGTPEPTTFDDRDAGFVLIVGIDGPGALPRVEKRPVNGLDWPKWEVDLTEQPAELLDEQRQRVSGLADRSRTLLQLCLTGTVGLECMQAVDDFEAWLCAQGLLYVDVQRNLVATELAASALGRLAEKDAVISGVVADLEALGALSRDSGSTKPDSLADPLQIEDLLALWGTVKRDLDVDRKVVVGNALTRLAQLVKEVMR